TALAQPEQVSSQSSLAILFEPSLLATFGLKVDSASKSVLVTEKSLTQPFAISIQDLKVQKDNTIQAQVSVSELQAVVRGRDQVVRMEADGLLLLKTDVNVALV